MSDPVHDLHKPVTATDAEAIDVEVRQVVLAQAQRNIRSGEALAKLAALYAMMYDLFQAKPVGTLLCGFMRFDEWGTSRFEPLHESMEVSRRQAFYYAKIGRLLLPRIGEQKLVELRIEKAKALLPMVQAKNEVSDEMMEFTEHHSAADVRSEVRRQLFKGNPDHSPGPNREYMVTGGEGFIIDLMDDLNYGRQVEFGDGPSDAEILHLMCQAYRQEKGAENAQEHARLAGFANAQQHSLYRLVEETASLRAKVKMHQDFSKFTMDLKFSIMQDVCRDYQIPWESVSPVPASAENEG
jgi:hypothetical protein